MGKIKQWIIAHKLWSIIIASVLVVGITLSISLPLALRHKHTFSDAWKVNETEHWHVCTGEKCDKTKDKEKHTFVSKSEGEKTWEECSVCKKIKSTLVVDVADFTYGDDYDHFEIDWIKKGYSGGCEYDSSLYGYEYFKMSEDGETATSLGETFPVNAGKYKVVVTYDGDAEEGYLPTSAVSEFTISKRTISGLRVFVDESSIPTDVDETLNAPVMTVKLGAGNVTYESNVANDNKILAGDEVDARIIFYGASAGPRIKNSDYRLIITHRQNTIHQKIELDSENYCLQDQSLSVGKLFIAKKLTNGEQTNISVTGNENNDSFYYSFTFTVEAGQKVNLTLTKTTTGDSVSYETLSDFAPSVSFANSLFLNASSTTKTVTFDNSTGTSAISTTIYICVDPASGVKTIQNSIKIDYEVVND